MKQRIVFSVLGLSLAGLLVWAFWPSAQVVEVERIRQGRFERTVDEDGKTRLRDRYVISTPLAGRVLRINLRQGDAVRQGDVLATVQPADPALLDQRSRAQQRERVGALDATADRARANIERAKAALAQAQADTLRIESLARQSFVAPTQVESARLAQRLREKELESARSELDAAQHELAQARIALLPAKDAAGALSPWRVKSPLAATVLRVVQQSEGVWPAGTPLIELGDPAQLEVVVDLLTEAAAQLKPGAPVRLSGWGGPALAGRLRLIEPAAFTKVSALGVEEQRVNAVIDISSPPEQWRNLGDGFRVEVRIEAEVIDAALLVPVSALFPPAAHQSPPDGASHALYVMAEGRAQLRWVRQLARNGREAAIAPVAGLRGDEWVVIYPSATLRDQARIRAAR